MGGGHHLRSICLHCCLTRATLKGNIVQGKNNLYSAAALFLSKRIDWLNSKYRLNSMDGGTAKNQIFGQVAP